MKTIVVCAVKPWSLAEAANFRGRYDGADIHLVTERSGLTIDMLERKKPDYVFFPHWSWPIPREMYANYNCVIFHPTDLPYGRGGTPIQHLIAAGHVETVITAIKATGEMDAGDVYVKRPLSLLGGGEEIMLRMQRIIFCEMIPFILENDIVPVPQEGASTTFKRRTAEMSRLPPNMTIEQMYDAIRMLDIEGYPRAFIRFGDYTVSLSRPALRCGGLEVTAMFSKEEVQRD